MAAPTAPGQKLFGAGTDGTGSAVAVAALPRLVTSLSVAAPTAPGQKLFGGGTEGAGSEACRWRWRLVAGGTDGAGSEAFSV